MNEQQNELLYAVIKCPHDIDRDSLVLRFADDNSGPNAFNQLARRLSPYQDELNKLRAENAELKKENSRLNVALLTDCQEQAEINAGMRRMQDENKLLQLAVDLHEPLDMQLRNDIEYEKARADALAKELHELKQSIRVEGMDPDGSIWEHADKLHKDLENHKVMLENACLDKRDLKQQLAGKNVALAEANEIKIAFSDAVDRLEEERDSLNQQLAAKDAELEESSGAWNVLNNVADTCRSRGFTDGAVDERVIAMAQERDELREQLVQKTQQLETARTALEDNIEVLQDCQQSLQEFRCLSDDVYDAMPARVFEVERAIKQSQTALAHIAAAGGAVVNVKAVITEDMYQSAKKAIEIFDSINGKKVGEANL